MGEISIQDFIREVERSFLLEEDEKKYWIAQAEKMNPVLLRLVHEKVRSKNELVDKYILAAVKDNPALLEELKQSINKIKKDALMIEEKASTLNADDFLKQQLENV